MLLHWVNANSEPDILKKYTEVMSYFRNPMIPTLKRKPGTPESHF